MAFSLRHKFVSEIPDTGDEAIVQPTDWNDEHDILMSANRVLGRSTGDGPAQELPLSVAADGTVTAMGPLYLTTPAVQPTHATSKQYVDDKVATAAGSASTGLALKADKTYVDSQNAAQDTAVAAKVDKAYVDGQNAVQDTAIAGKAPTVHTHPWGQITGTPSAYPPSAHQHPWTDITSPPLTYPPAAHTHAYSSLTGIPATFTPSAHAHPTSDVTGLDTALAGKEPAIVAGNAAMFWAGNKTWKPSFVQLTQAAYDALGTKDPNTLYVVVG